MSENNEGAEGFLDQIDTSSEYNVFFFKVMSILAQNNFVVPVEVMSATSAGELAVTGVLSVRPLVNQERADGVVLQHGVINGIPYLRMQGGTDAIIMDPKKGDLGLMVCADKDISAVKSNKAISNAGSGRVHDYSDGVYVGGLLNGVPQQYIRFHPDGIDIHSPKKIKITADQIEITAVTSIKENAPDIAMTATTKISTTAPQVTTDATTITTNATTISVTATASVTTTTPVFNVVGAANISGLTSLNGGFAAQPRAGGAASTIAGPLNISGVTTLTNTLNSNSAANFTSNITSNGKNIGDGHAHTGVTTGAGVSGGVA